MTEYTEIPVDIAKAILKAMGKIKTLAKEDKNEHDKYNFASIDAFLTAVNPICAECGLLFWVNETNITDFIKNGKYGENSWVRITYEIIVYHTSGQSMPGVKRSVEVMRNGAQAFGSAQSYVLKQFMRSLFLIPTGDKDDADYEKTDNGIAYNNSPVNQSKPLAKTGAGKTDATRAVYGDLSKEIDACDGDLDAMKILVETKDFQTRIKALPVDWQKEVQAKYAEIKANVMAEMEKAA